MFRRFDAWDLGLDLCGFDDDSHFGRRAAVSDRAKGVRDRAEQTFLTHLASVDTSLGSVTTELIKEHLVPDMRKAFGRFVKDHGCTATFRQISRGEQDAITKYKNRQSLVWFTIVKVTPEAQKTYLSKHPEKATEHKATSSVSAPVACSSGSAAEAKTALGKRSLNTLEAPMTPGPPVKIAKLA